MLVAIALYLPALHNGFIWDDPIVLQQLRAMHSLGDLIVMPPIVPKFYYRPFIFATYLLDRAIGGEAPSWFHVSVVCWHALNTLLVLLLAERLFPHDPLIAAGGALLFAVFPTHVESVAWMAGRSDVIVAAFMLLTVWLFLSAHPLAAWAAGATYLLALLSKETAVACLLLIPLLDGLRGVPLTRQLGSRYLPLLLATVVYFLLRRASLGAYVGGASTGTATATLILEVVRAVGFYIVHAVAPTGLCAYVPDVPSGPGYLLIGGAVPALGGLLAVWAWRRNAWPVAFFALWFFVTLAPSLTVIVRRSASAVVADRYLYVPTVGSCVLCAWLIVRLGQWCRLGPRRLGIALLLVSVVYALPVMPYTRVWTDNLTFWSDVAAKVPGDAMPHRELAAALLNAGRLDEAERALQRALAARSSPEGRLMTLSNLGNLYRRQGRYADAEQAFEEGMKLAAHPALYHNLGLTLMNQIQQEQRAGDAAAVQRDLVRARDAFQQALIVGDAPGAQDIYIEWDPAKTHALLGQVLFNMNDRRGARMHLETALRLEPTGTVAEVTRRYLQKIGG